MNSTPHLLIIDDDINIRSFLKKFLEKQGYRVTLAADGLEGIDSAQKIRPDLILLDVVMPNIDGVETGKRLRKIPETRSIPIIFLSAAFFEEAGEDKAQAPNEVFLMKPFDVKELLRVIQDFTRPSDH
jgi:two-component system OmpR family response regulator